MDCGNCGSPAAPGQKFCGECGTPLASGCPGCGAENPPGQKFCGECGTPLTGAAPPPPTPSETPAATERRVVSVLFVDLVGFTSFSESRDPEDVRALITRYFDLASEAIGNFGGTVDKFIGDAVMAWWGATTSQEDDAERATRAALDIVDRVTTLGEEEGIEGLAARAGVMTGEASVGPGGNEKGLLLGDLVNSASRLQSLAAPGSVFVGARTADLIASALEVTSEGSHLVKGKETPLEAFRVGRMLGSSYRPGREVIEPPFVGRDSELRILKDNLHAVDRDHRARLVSLVGHAGIGKSRLIWEFLKYVDGLVDTVYWHEGRSPSYGDGLAMWALGEMIRRRCGIAETDQDDVTLSRLADTVAEFIGDPEERAWVEPRLATVLGVGASVAGERTELFAAARALFEAIADRGTTVLVFEDVQWADPSLLEFVEELPDWSQNHPILVVSVTRPDLLDRRPDWGSGRRGFTSIYLSPLSTAEIHELVGGAVPGIPDHAVERIAEAAGGIPLFAVEMLRMLVGDGRLALADGAYRITGDLSELEVPSSVHAVVAARLDRLPLEARDLARDAAVLGFSFTLSGLAALRDAEPDKVERQLSILVRNEILELIRDPRSPEAGQYQWVQAVLREVAYGRVSRSDRHELHLRAARLFRDLADPELAPVAASHYLSAMEATSTTTPEVEAEAVEALSAAIDRSRDLHAHEQTIALVEKALPVIPRPLEPALRERAAKAAIRIADTDTADRHVEALIAQGEEGDLDRLHLGMALLGLVGNSTQRSMEIVDRLGAHLEAYPDISDSEALARAAVYHSRALMLSGHPEIDVAAVADRAIGPAEHMGLLEEVADAMITRGTALSNERYHQALALIRGAVQLCREHGFTDTLLRGLINLGYASNDPDESAAATEAAFAEAKRVGDRNHATFVAGNLIGLYHWLLDVDRIAEVLDDPILTTDPGGRVQYLNNLAGLRVWQGDLEGARTALAEARDEARGLTDPQAQLALERSAAILAFWDGDFETEWEIGLRHFETYDFAPAIAIGHMARAATALRDHERLDRVLGLLADLPVSAFVRASQLRAEVQVALMEGRTEDAVRVADEGIVELEGYRARQDAAWLAAVAARDLPAGPERERFDAYVRDLAHNANAPGLVLGYERFLETRALSPGSR